MIVDKEGTTATVFQDHTSIREFRRELENGYQQIKDDNIIVNLGSFEKLSTDEVLLFHDLSDRHKAKKHSFVLVTDRVSYDDVPESLCVVPTLQEAHDMIAMEEIERDLDL